MSNTRCSYHPCHSGNSKGFRSSVSATGDKNIFLSQFQSQIGCPLVVIKWFAATVVWNYEAQVWWKKRERALSVWGRWEFDRILKFTVSQLRSRVWVLWALWPRQGGRPRWAVRPGSGLELHWHLRDWKWRLFGPRMKIRCFVGNKYQLSTNILLYLKWHSETLIMAYRVPHGAAPVSLIHCAPAGLSFSFSSKPSLFPASEPLCVLFPVLEMLFSSRRRLIPQIHA